VNSCSCITSAPRIAAPFRHMPIALCIDHKTKREFREFQQTPSIGGDLRANMAEGVGIY
jgi:hypothetical protein